MRVKSIEITNFKNIKEFKQEFVQGVYLLTGDNEMGKSSTIDAIMLCLTGNNIPAEAITKGEEKGKIKLVVGDDKKVYTIERKFTKSNPNGYLEILTEDGMKSDKVGMLQTLFNYTDFSADEFIKWSDSAEGRRKQLDIVKSFLSKETQEKILELDRLKVEVFNSRSSINAEIKVYSNILKGDNFNEEFLRKYADPVSVEELQTKYQEATKKNNEIANIVVNRNNIQERISTYDQDTKDLIEKSNSNIIDFDSLTDASLTDIDENILDYEKQITELQAKVQVSIDKRKNLIETREKERKALELAKNHLIETREADKVSLDNSLIELNEWLKNNDEAKVEEIADEIKTASEHNANNTKVSEHLKKKEKLTTLEVEANLKTATLTEIADKREALVKTAELPVQGLNFSDEGLTLNGLPFDSIQVATSQKIEVAAKLMIAKNPKVQVFKVLNGESLGQEKLDAIIKFAKDNGYQGFIEEVRRGQDQLKVELIENTGIETLETETNS